MPDEQPPANRMTLATFKTRLGGAKKGHSLLKKKRDALKARFYKILAEIVDAKLNSGYGLKEASFALAKAQWQGDDITSLVVERASKPACTVQLSGDNVAGVGIPKFKYVYDKAADEASATLGVAHGGAVIGACRMEYLKAVGWLVKLASLQTAFKTLDHEIKMTSRRVNALEYVLIPKIEGVLQYITQELDEQTREEFFRVKKVVEKKKAKMEREKALYDAEHSAPASVVAPQRQSMAQAALAASEGFLGKLVNVAEKMTGVDLDEDGDVGKKGAAPSDEEAEGGKKKKNKKKKGGAGTALDNQDEDVVF